MPIVILLTIPAIGVWAWNDGGVNSPPKVESIPTIHRLPVEIISTNTAPEWVLVPVDPS
ncbi:MAG: hypothetical protein ACSHX7_05660 [Luteolibacter sp.]